MAGKPVKRPFSSIFTPFPFLFFAIIVLAGFIINPALAAEKTSLLNIKVPSYLISIFSFLFFVFLAKLIVILTKFLNKNDAGFIRYTPSEDPNKRLDSTFYQTYNFLQQVADDQLIVSDKELLSAIQIYFNYLSPAYALGLIVYLYLKANLNKNQHDAVFNLIYDRLNAQNLAQLSFTFYLLMDELNGFVFSVKKLNQTRLLNFFSLIFKIFKSKINFFYLSRMGKVTYPPEGGVSTKKNL